MSVYKVAVVVLSNYLKVEETIVQGVTVPQDSCTMPTAADLPNFIHKTIHSDRDYNVLEMRINDEEDSKQIKSLVLPQYFAKFFTEIDDKTCETICKSMFSSLARVVSENDILGTYSRDTSIKLTTARKELDPEDEMEVQYFYNYLFKCQKLDKDLDTLIIVDNCDSEFNSELTINQLLEDYVDECYIEVVTSKSEDMFTDYLYDENGKKYEDIVITHMYL